MPAIGTICRDRFYFRFRIRQRIDTLWQIMNQINHPGSSIFTVKTRQGRCVNFFRFHSLSLVTLGILLIWVLMYIYSDPNTHAGAFFGNAIADWSGTVVVIVATKYLFERGSEESRPVHGRLKNPVLNLLRGHSLSIFLIITGCGWFLLYARMDSNSRWGQVVGNISSEWVQTLGLVLLTKRLIERGSRESRKAGPS
jgi:hypothetical protein